MAQVDEFPMTRSDVVSLIHGKGTKVIAEQSDGTFAVMDTASADGLANVMTFEQAMSITKKITKVDAWVSDYEDLYWEILRIMTVETLSVPSPSVTEHHISHLISRGVSSRALRWNADDSVYYVTEEGLVGKGEVALKESDVSPLMREVFFHGKSKDRKSEIISAINNLANDRLAGK